MFGRARGRRDDGATRLRRATAARGGGNTDSWTQRHIVVAKTTPSTLQASSDIYIAAKSGITRRGNLPILVLPRLTRTPNSRLQPHEGHRADAATHAIVLDIHGTGHGT